MEYGVGIAKASATLSVHLCYNKSVESPSRTEVAKILISHLKDIPKPARAKIHEYIDAFCMADTMRFMEGNMLAGKECYIKMWCWTDTNRAWWVMLQWRWYMLQFIGGSTGYRVDKHTRRGWQVIKAVDYRLTAEDTAQRVNEVHPDNFDEGEG